MNHSKGFLGEAFSGGWRILLAGVMGMALGISALPFYTLGVFAQPVADDFAWSRTMVVSGLSFQMVGTVLVAWLAGWMIDRYSVRKIALFSQAGLALAFFLLALQNGSLWLWQLNWFMLALLGIGTSPMSWSRGIVEKFESGRGLALGIALSGSGITAFAGPPLIETIIEAYGWRAGYFALAGAITLVGIPSTWFLFRISAQQNAGSPAKTTSLLTGLSFRQALSTRHFWLILLAFCTITFAISGTIPNLVPIMQTMGIRQAAYYVSLIGIAIIFSRLISGYLIDRFWAPGVAATLVLIAAGACGLLSQGIAPAFAVIAIGVAAGAEFDLIAFLCVRYFGMRAYGRIYSWLWAGFALATGMGSITIAYFVETGLGPAGVMLAVVGALVIAAAALLALGRYPDPREWDHSA
ncbi:MFS transporter [Sphingorhabdus sp. SMR4y]|uniref:MFS transporter n=1 Tax=Sphingorhabdus sp. SMR4y TaxID=2584094 RepID=UPI000B5E65AC|nr:MFS transporter [Sphingorhabdus sp. SMR4y]ASK88406.1 putative MFS-type transporter YhjX [Sphingorhabdus sp. SMR4y]